MEAVLRKPFQGMSNIIRFNWHFYAVAASLVVLLYIAKIRLPSLPAFFISAVIFIIIITTLVSLLASLYIYDLSGLYKLHWLNHLNPNPSPMIVNINAGFDETSILLRNKFPSASLRVMDFYDPSKHTEVSIKRARKTYAVFHRTETIDTGDQFLQEKSADVIFLILAAHEIRDDRERTRFFKHLGDALKPNGQIIVVEHLRNITNFLAYNIGFFHFFSEKSWRAIFDGAELNISKRQNITPFIVAFSLNKHGIAS